MKVCKKPNNFELLHCSSGLSDHSTVTQSSKGTGEWGGGRLVDFVMKRYGEGEGVLNAFFSCHSLFLFTSGKVT